MQSFASASSARMSEPDGNDVMIDLKSGDITVMNSTDKTYYVMTQKDMDEMTARLKEMMNSPEMKQMQERMKNLPPEQRKKMEAMMGSAMAVDVEKSGTRTIAGYKCENWTITIGQYSKMEQCVTTDLKFPAAAWEQFKKFTDRSKAMMSAMGPMVSSFTKMQDEMQKVKGFPIATKQTTTIMGRSTVTTSELTSVSRGPIPASAWQIPAGYKQVDSPLKQAMQRPRH